VALVLLPDLVAVGRRDRRGKLELRSAFLDGSNEWQVCIGAARRLLAEIKVGGQDNVAALFSDRFAAYFALPWSNRLLRRRDGAAFIREHINGLDADISSAAEIRVSDAGFSGPRIACAVERNFLSAIKETLHESGARLARCVPLLSVCTEKASGQLRKGPALVATLERHAVRYAVYLNGFCSDVGTELIVEISSATVQAALERIKLRDSRLDNGLTAWIFDAASDEALDLSDFGMKVAARVAGASRAESLVHLALEAAP
jgi:hypothetical protein